jgi:hypothetical protein
MTVSLEDRIRGGLYGLLVGDALGVPYEFHSPSELPPLARIEMQPPPGIPQHWLRDLRGQDMVQPLLSPLLGQK